LRLLRRLATAWVLPCECSHRENGSPRPLLPDHDVVVVDEAHELVDRATGAVTDELTAAMVERAARRIRRYVAAETYEGLATAATEGAKLRFRPIMMTALAFILGVVPLVVASGATVRVSNEYGFADFLCKEGKIPLGMLFVPYGPPTCRLMGQTTDGTGMPTSKGWEVEVLPVVA